MSCPGPLLRLGGRSGPGSLLLGLGMWGWRKGVPWGGAFHCCEGRLGSGAPPPLTARPLGGLLGSATHVLWAQACGCGGPTLSPWPARPVGAACRGGGGGPSPYLAWGCWPPVGRVRGVCVLGGGLGGRGRPVRRAPRLCGRGGPVGRGVALPRSVPLPSLGRQQSGCHWRRSVHGGRGPPYHSGSCTPAFTGRDLCGVLARWRGLACPCGFCGSRRLGRGGGPRSNSSLGRGEGGPSPLPRGLRAGAPAACGLVGGVGGGGVAPRPPCSPSGWRPAVPYPGPPLVVGARPPGVRVRSGSRGRPGVGGDKGRPMDRSPGAPSDLNPPSALPAWAVVIGGVMGGAASILFWCAAVCRPQAWSVCRSGALVWARPSAASPAGAGSWGRWGTRYAGPAASPPPPRRGPFWGRGGVPSAPGGRRVAPVALKLGGAAGGGGVGRPPPRPPAPSGVGLPSVVPGVPPRGILVPWGLPGGRGHRARPGRLPMGQCGGGGGRGGEPPRPCLRLHSPRAGL